MELGHLPIALLLLSGAAFVGLRGAVGGKYLDEVISIKEARGLLSRLTDLQKRRHLWMTLGPDSLFPACYATCLVQGVLWCSCMDYRPVLYPALLAAGMDYAENVTHVIGLWTGELPWLKTLFSIGKWVFLTTAVFTFPGAELLAAITRSLWG